MTRRPSLLSIAALASVAALTLSTTSAIAATKKTTKKTTTKKVTATTAPATAAPTTTVAAPAKAGILAKDATDGKGAEYFNARLNAVATKPLVATGDPIVIGLRNTEGNAGGSFPDAREGAEAAVKFINEKLGGVGADPATGKAGRPIKIEKCIDQLVPDQATSCAQTLASKNPSAIYIAIDFFTALEYATYSKFAVFNSLPISSADWNNPSVIDVGGGCVSAFPSGMLAMQKAGAKKVAIAYSDNAPGNQCYSLTQKPILEELGVAVEGFPFTPGSPDLSSVAQKVIDSKADFVEFGVADIDCAKLFTSLKQLGYKGTIYAAGSCYNKARIKEVGDAADGVVFGFIGYSADLNPADVPAFGALEAKAVDAGLDAGGVTNKTGFARFNFARFMFVWELADEVARSGKTINADNLRAQGDKAKDHHMMASQLVDCSAKITGYISACEFIGGYYKYGSKDGSLTKVYANVDPRDILKKVGPKLPK
jgi:branched-chain amino acid transport system substrate-binding protein